MSISRRWLWPNHVGVNYRQEEVRVLRIPAFSFESDQRLYLFSNCTVHFAFIPCLTGSSAEAESFRLQEQGYAFLLFNWLLGYNFVKRMSMSWTTRVFLLNYVGIFEIVNPIGIELEQLSLLKQANAKIF